MDDLTPEGEGMVVGREEMRFDFGAARFQLPQDAALLGWIFDQFLYGEITGIQCGHWLYQAPDLEAANFFARQAVEELSHVRQFMKLYEAIGQKPGPAHPVIRFLATGSMGKSYAEHVAIEMATGESLVLMVFYALIDTIDDEYIRKILLAASRQEERHVAFGEQQTRRLVRNQPALAAPLLGLNLISIQAIRQLAKYVDRHLDKKHGVVAQAPAFLAQMLAVLELRLQKLGLLNQPLAQLNFAQRAGLMLKGYLWRLSRAWARKPKSLTRTYLHDPSLRP
jgi:hypothetical protein